jgi:hypothetical protein
VFVPHPAAGTKHLGKSGQLLTFRTFDKTGSVQHLVKHAGMNCCIDTKPPLANLLPLMIYAELCIWQMICIMHRNDVHQLLSAPYIYRKLYRMFIEVGLMLANLNSLPRA